MFPNGVVIQFSYVHPISMGETQETHLHSSAAVTEGMV